MVLRSWEGLGGTFNAGIANLNKTTIDNLNKTTIDDGRPCSAKSGKAVEVREICVPFGR
jgi:hypothetical protein